MEIELHSHEYFIDKINRVIKNEISMYFYVHHKRSPTKEEYEAQFKTYKERLECVVTDYDLGIWNDGK